MVPLSNSILQTGWVGLGLTGVSIGVTLVGQSLVRRIKLTIEGLQSIITAAASPLTTLNNARIYMCQSDEASLSVRQSDEASLSVRQSDEASLSVRQSDEASLTSLFNLAIGGYQSAKMFVTEPSATCRRQFEMLRNASSLIFNDFITSYETCFGKRMGEYPQYKYLARPVCKFVASKTNLVFAVAVSFFVTDLIMHQAAAQVLTCGIAKSIDPSISCPFMWCPVESLLWTMLALPVMYAKYMRGTPIPEKQD